MKTVCALIALSACSSVAMADYIIDTLTGGAHSVTLTGTGSQTPSTFPTNSDAPGAFGSRFSIYQTGVAGAGSAATMTSSVGGGQMNMAWNITAAAGNSGTLALAMTSLTYYFTNAHLGSSTVLSYAAWGSFSGAYTTAEVNIQVLDTNGHLASWWIPFTPGPLTGLQLDLAAPADYTTPGFDVTGLSVVTLQFTFLMQPAAQADPVAMAGEGSLTVSQLQFIPTPSAAALLGLGGIAATRRRR